MLSFLRWLRHGPLAFLGPFWVALGKYYRQVVRRLPGLTVRQKIGPYGPFRLSAEFTFSNFDHWGGAHNRGFHYGVEACRGKTCVLDIGAHIGLVTLPVASVLGEGGRVYAFEPARANADLLRRHINLNNVRNAIVIEALVGANDEDQVSFYESAGPHGQNSIVLKGEEKLDSEWGRYSITRRPQLSIDSFCRQHGIAPQVVKIDVEGAEIGVLRGARETLRQGRPLIILSVHPREIAMAGESLDNLRALLDGFGYDIRDSEGRPVAELKLDEYVVAPREASPIASAMTR